jgi:hypothetical protein
MKLCLKGAYGRKATIQDWQDGKDFTIYHVPPDCHGLVGTYVSNRDIETLKEFGFEQVQLLDNVMKPLAKVAL